MDKTDFSLVVSPVLTRIKAYSNSTSASIRIKNTTSKDISLRLALRPFTSSPSQDGSIIFTDKVNGPDKSILKKTKIFEGGREITCKAGMDCSLKLLPFEEKTLNMKMDLGSKMQSGDYYFSLLFVRSDVQNTSAGETYSLVQPVIASNFLLSVNSQEANLPIGPLRRIEASRQEITEVDISSPFFLTRGPVGFKIFVTNDSNHVLDIQGNVFVTDMFGHKIGKVDLPSQYILANSSRYLSSGKEGNISKGIEVLQDTPKTAFWNEKFLLGVYTARAEVLNKETNQTRVSETKFVAIPTFLLITIAILAFIIGGVYLKIKKKI